MQVRGGQLSCPAAAGVLGCSTTVSCWHVQQMNAAAAPQPQCMLGVDSNALPPRGAPPATRHDRRIHAPMHPLPHSSPWVPAGLPAPAAAGEDHGRERQDGKHAVAAGGGKQPCWATGRSGRCVLLLPWMQQAQPAPRSLVTCPASHTPSSPAPLPPPTTTTPQAIQLQRKAANMRSSLHRHKVNQLMVRVNVASCGSSALSPQLGWCPCHT
jgi:hypothetical protein